MHAPKLAENHVLSRPPDHARHALEKILGGATPRDLETELLDFKEPVVRSEKDTLDLMVRAAVCFVNASGGIVLLGVDDDVGGPTALVGSDVDIDRLRHRVYELTRPALTVGAYEVEIFGRRLVAMDVPQGAEVHSDSQSRVTRRVGAQCLPMTPQESSLLRDERRGFDWSAQPSNRVASEVSEGAVDLARDRLLRSPTPAASWRALRPTIFCERSESSRTTDPS